MSELVEAPRPPEVPFNTVLLDCLRKVDKSLTSSKGESPFSNTGDSITVNNSGVGLATVSGDNVEIAGESFQDRLISQSSSSETADISQRFGNFLVGISDNLVRLNHVGVSYYSDDIQQESEKIQRQAGSSGIPLHEEISPDPKEKWYFWGNTENWEEPLVELVLNEKDQRLDFWKPHFQIDIDTNLTLDQIRQLTDEYLGKDFVKWQLDIPGHGTVLAMGVLGQIGDTKISLGIGTNLRGTEHHRKYELKPVNSKQSLVEPK